MSNKPIENRHPSTTGQPALISTHEGATAFSIDDPLVRLTFTYGSFLPENDTYYASPEKMMEGFMDALTQAATAHPELTLQYVAWQRDPHRGKGNRSQPPWAIAILASISECLQHPRFTELVARSIVRPDDALYIILAMKKLWGDNSFPLQIKQAIAQGLENMSAYQLAKYAQASVNLLPEKRSKDAQKTLPEPATSTTELVTIDEAPVGQRTLRFVDILGICKRELSPRLFVLYRYLHAPTRQRATLTPIVEQHFPLLIRQKYLRAHAPTSPGEVTAWVQQALEARMTMEQMFAAIGQFQPMYHLPPIAEASIQTEEQASEKKVSASKRLVPADVEQHKNMVAADIRSQLWQSLLNASVPDEGGGARQMKFLGDTAFLRNVRDMFQNGVPLDNLNEAARQRSFAGIWPFQILSAARTIEHGKKRGRFKALPCPGVLPVFDTIFEQIALPGLPRKKDGSFYRILGLADTSGSMTVPLAGKAGSATCMDAAIALTTACSYTTRSARYGGLAGSWDTTFHAVEVDSKDQPLRIAQKIQHSGGMGGTQIFGSIMSLAGWLQKHPEAPRPEALIVFSDMQFHPASKLAQWEIQRIPEHYRKYLQQPEFKSIPPLAAAIVLYREILGQDISVIPWNLASYEGSPAPSKMDRVLLLSGFDTNSFRIVEQWLQAGSPGGAMPMKTTSSPDKEENRSSFEAVLTALRHY